MKLFVIRASHNCRRVLATAAHLGLELDVVEPDLTSGALKEESFLALNPNGKVPTLECDDGVTLWEGNAIMVYLASLKPESTLWPKDPIAQASVLRWQFWDANHLSKGTTGLVFENIFKPMFMKQEPDPAEVEKANSAFATTAPILNAHLEGKSYLLGDTLTLADFSVAASFTYAEAAGAPVADYPHIKAWLARMDENEAWSASKPAM